MSHPNPSIPLQEVPITRSRTVAPGRTPLVPVTPSPESGTAIPQGGHSLNHLLKLIESALEDHKAQDITVINMAGKAAFADYMVVATGTSSRHVASMADEVAQTLKPHLTYPIKVEGQQAAEWVCVDAGDIIIHLFQPIARQLYNLDKLWSFPPEQA